MFTRTVSFLALFVAANSAFAAAPKAYIGYCMAVQPGTPPQSDVSIKHGESKELFQQGDFVYTISYIDDVGGKNVLELKVFNKATNKQNLARLEVKNEFPSQIELVTETANTNFTCITQ